MKLSAILFDLDGTLTDSARLFCDATRQGLSALGVQEMHMEIFSQWVSHHEHWEVLAAKHGADSTQWQLLQRVTFEHFDALLATDSQWLEGVEETVRALTQRGMPMAIVTNSQDQFIDTIDKSLPLKSLFPLIITATLTQERRKPDPYGLLLAAEKLGVHPQDCLYVGDQRFDIRAAKAAGMHDCLYVGSHTPADTELIATHRVYDLRDILKLID